MESLEFVFKDYSANLRVLKRKLGVPEVLFVQLTLPQTTLSWTLSVECWEEMHGDLWKKGVKIPVQDFNKAVEQLRR
jgi:hypothetical protein